MKTGSPAAEASALHNTYSPQAVNQREKQTNMFLSFFLVSRTWLLCETMILLLYISDQRTSNKTQIRYNTPNRGWCVCVRAAAPVNVQRTVRGQRGWRCEPPGCCQRDSGKRSEALRTTSSRSTRRQAGEQRSLCCVWSTSHRDDTKSLSCHFNLLQYVLGAYVIGTSFSQHSQTHEPPLPLIGVFTGEAGLSEGHLMHKFHITESITEFSQDSWYQRIIQH